jgi:hypothetical protein
MFLAFCGDDYADGVDKDIASFSLAYADQNERGCQTLLNAIRAGRIETEREPQRPKLLRLHPSLHPLKSRPEK